VLIIYQIGKSYFNNVHFIYFHSEMAMKQCESQAMNNAERDAKKIEEAEKYFPQQPQQAFAMKKETVKEKLIIHNDGDLIEDAMSE